MAVPIAARPDQQTIEAGSPVPLFATRLASGSGITGVARKPQYAVAPNGQFLMNVAIEGTAASPITIVLNWTAGLKP